MVYGDEVYDVTVQGAKEPLVGNRTRDNGPIPLALHKSSIFLRRSSIKYL